MDSNYNFRRTFLIISFLSITILFLSYTNTFQALYQNLLLKSQLQSESNISNLQRVITLDYYLNFESTNFQKIFGNGIASRGKGEYGSLIEYNEDYYTLSLDDNSYLAHYIYFGIFGLFSTIITIFKFLNIKHSDIHHKNFLFFCLISGLLSYNLFHFSYISIMTITFYCVLVKKNNLI
jgi:hypothetical protein